MSSIPISRHILAVARQRIQICCELAKARRASPPPCHRGKSGQQLALVSFWSGHFHERSHTRTLSVDTNLTVDKGDGVAQKVSSSNVRFQFLWIHPHRSLGAHITEHVQPSVALSQIHAQTGCVIDVAETPVVLIIRRRLLVLTVRPVSVLRVFGASIVAAENCVHQTAVVCQLRRIAPRATTNAICVQHVSHRAYENSRTVLCSHARNLPHHVASVCGEGCQLLCQPWLVSHGMETLREIADVDVFSTGTRVGWSRPTRAL